MFLMAADLNMALMRATFKLDQLQDDSTRTVGSGWLMRLPAALLGGTVERVALVTAGHVFDRMKRDTTVVHWRRQDEAGRWVREPKNLKIRDAGGEPLWLRHPSRDVAVIEVTPPSHARAQAIDMTMLADGDTFDSHDIRPGDEFLALGYPKGITANDAGFPILRSGRVASFPLSPPTEYPTFLMDFAVFAGNSGGPVYMSERARRRPGSLDFESAQFVAGMLAQQVMLTDERLEIGIVIHAVFVREALERFASTLNRAGASPSRPSWVGA